MADQLAPLRQGPPDDKSVRPESRAAGVVVNLYFCGNIGLEV